jgi:hypothetical protein
VKRNVTVPSGRSRIAECDPDGVVELQATALLAPTRELRVIHLHEV